MSDHPWRHYCHQCRLQQGVRHRSPRHTPTEDCTAGCPGCCLQLAGWCFSPTTRTAWRTAARHPHCSRSRPALYRARRLARRRTSSTLQTYRQRPGRRRTCPSVWNSLPSDAASAPSLAVFGRRLKYNLQYNLVPAKAGRKVMAAYHLVDNIVTCGLTACTPGSAPGLTLGNEYGKLLSLSFILQSS